MGKVAYSEAFRSREWAERDRANRENGSIAGSALENPLGAHAVV